MAPSTNSTGKSKRQSSHKRKRLKQEDVVFTPKISPSIPSVFANQTNNTPSLTSTQEPDFGIAPDVGSAAASTTSSGGLLSAPTAPNAPTTPTALLDHFNVHAPPVFSIRDERSRGRHIHFGFEQPPCKMV